MLTNSPTWSSFGGPYGGPCLSFDGSNDYVNFSTDIKNFFHNASFTVCLWVKSGITNEIMFNVKRSFICFTRRLKIIERYKNVKLDLNFIMITHNYYLTIIQIGITLPLHLIQFHYKNIY